MSVKPNGSYYCPVGEEWGKHREEAKVCMQQVDIMHESVAEMLNHIRYLDKLDKLEKLETIALSVQEMKDKLVEVIVGKNQIPGEAFDKMIEELKQMRASTFRLIFVIIAGLLGVLVFLLTGEHFGWLRALH